MVNPKFKVGDLVTRGRGRVTYHIFAVHASPNPYYTLVEAHDGRTRPRKFYGVAESNLRLAKEADNE